MGRRKGTGGGIEALLLGAFVVIFLIPKEIWIALLWFAGIALLGWVGWRLYHNWQAVRRASSLPPSPEDTGKTLAEIMAESSGKSAPVARRMRGPAVAPRSPSPVPSPRPFTPAAALQPPPPQVTADLPPAVATPRRPTPALEPVPVRTTSPLRASADLASPIRQPAPPRWVPLGKTIAIRGQEIVGGGFYLGTPRNYQDSRLASIDPTLPFSTNKSEQFNRFIQWIFFGQQGLIAQNVRHEQRKIVKYSHLVANLVMLHNLDQMTRILAELQAAEEDLPQSVVGVSRRIGWSTSIGSGTTHST